MRENRALFCEKRGAGGTCGVFPACPPTIETTTSSFYFAAAADARSLITACERAPLLQRVTRTKVKKDVLLLREGRGASSSVQQWGFPAARATVDPPNVGERRVRGGGGRGEEEIGATCRRVGRASTRVMVNEVERRFRCRQRTRIGASDDSSPLLQTNVPGGSGGWSNTASPRSDGSASGRDLGLLTTAKDLTF